MYKYAIIGSGTQGTASAFDLIKFGDAEKVFLIDNLEDNLHKSAEHLKRLTNSDNIETIVANVTNEELLLEKLKGVDSIISGVPYYFNLGLTKIAIQLGANFCDFGGNTKVVEEQLAFNQQALEKNISIIPDCGMDPGMNISFIQYLTTIYDKLVSVKSYGAGLLQNPKPPWNYGLSFHINGLTNEYYGNALFLRDSKVTEVPCLTELEILEFPEPLGKLEAAVTSGGLSTLPYELEGRISKLENRTLRYPGHWERFKAYSDLGLFEENPIEVDGVEIIPRSVYHKLLEPKITLADKRDVCIIKIVAEGEINKKNVSTEIELIDYYDERTGFTAMQRLTGWHASVMAILAAKNKVAKGAVSVSKAVDGGIIINELKKRELKIRVK